MKQKKNKKNNYKLGSYVTPKYADGGFAKFAGTDTSALGAPIGVAGNMIGGAIGGPTGNVVNGIASGAAAGASLGPIGMGVGALFGAGASLLGNKKAAATAMNARNEAYTKNNQYYQDQFNSNLDTNNENAYGNLTYADGGPVDPKRKKLKSDGSWLGNLGADALNYLQSPSTEKSINTFRKKGKAITKDLVQIADPTGITNWGDTYDAFAQGKSTEEKVLNLLGSVPMIGKVPKVGKAMSGAYKLAGHALINVMDYGQLAKDITSDKMANGGPIKGKKSVYATVPKDLDWIHQDFTTSKGTMVTDAQYRAYKDKGMDFGNTQNLGLWIDSWAAQPKAAPAAIPTGREGMAYESTGLHNRQIGNKFETGGEVPIELINIEKGELQIDPNTGKVLREYTGMNPETGGLYTPHSKGKDPKHNFVSAEPGTFIITTKEAKKYKDAIDNNDKLHQNSILQNIKNYKESVEPKAKMANGSFVDWDTPLNMALTVAQAPGKGVYGSPIQSTMYRPQVQMTTGLAPLQVGTPPSQGLNLAGIGKGLAGAGDFLTNYGPALMNIGQGLFGNVEQQANVTPTINPYKSDILNNMPQDVSLDPIRQQLMRNQNTAFNQIDNTTSSNPVARANKQNVFANTQNQLGNFAMQVQGQNNQVRGQRASIYQGLGAQEMQAQDRATQLNLGIDEGNRANRGAKQNMLTTGLTQLQQTYQNEKLNRSRASMDKYKVDLLRQMFPNLKYYGDQFGSDALTKLIGQ